MAELSRTVQAAMRSAALLRAMPTQCQPVFRHILKGTPSAITSNGRLISTTPNLGSPTSPFSSNWSNPNRNTANLDSIRNPQSSSYNVAFGREEKKEGRDEETANPTDDFLADIYGIELGDIDTNKRPIPTPPAQRPTMRLVPRTGRTVHVRSNVDVARSFKLLSIQVATNKMRQDFYSQRFHERPGLKRKRLKSERWQRRFKKGFKATISRVRELTAQGW